MTTTFIELGEAR